MGKEATRDKGRGQFFLQVMGGWGLDSKLKVADSVVKNTSSELAVNSEEVFFFLGKRLETEALLYATRAVCFEKTASAC